jgi:hypothetical protein
VAYAAERGKLTQAQAERHRQALAEYQERYEDRTMSRRTRGEDRGRAPHRIPGTYASQADAEAAAALLGISEASVVEVETADGEWALYAA